jgi:hypothetical protein
MPSRCPCFDESLDPCPRCGATVSGNDAVNGICQADFIDKSIADAITALRADLAAAIARAEAAERASRELWAAIDKHEAWLKHEHAVCDAAGDRSGVIAYARGLASLRAALGERQP